MYYLGYDIGSSSIKVATVEALSGKKIITLQEPNEEMEIVSPHSNWAEQDPEVWWKHICIVTKRAIHGANIDASKIQAIGISYQMHGLVIVDKEGKPIRNAILWCDSRAVEIGNKAFNEIGTAKCMEHLMNSPGNFTASKLKWVRDNEPELYERIYKYMLPGDYIAHKLTEEIVTTKNGLSEGILWDYKNNNSADWLLEYYGIDNGLTPEIVNNFSNQGTVSDSAAKETGLPKGIPVTYRSGDQPNNALSLNIFNHGEVAATGGTSGVIYAVIESLNSKETERINQFAHVNYTEEKPSIGKLLCINGAGIMYRWLRNHGIDNSYENMNRKASKIDVGSNGVSVIPFGNGAERMFNNRTIGTHFCNLNLNKHSHGHLYRAALEGIAFSFVYGEILKNDHDAINVIRAGNDNLFRSEIFSNTVATLIGHEIEIYNTTGAIGAARAAGLINGNFIEFGENIIKNDHVTTYMPLKNIESYAHAYEHWKINLERLLNY
ncbi:xylulokinase [Flagellimonas sp. CMM7]|uniref:xylulokinase n=1 Tax=Flagellimonas sp. CMM7 TaxID=2654676 RepID=UPI0013D0B0C4|nr:FGGY family carbohydrate kinase [Flagellimonas sp. CMM7]UII79863.1 carbohydrate kinase [Flagellimonas sp. CMM7]